MELRLPRTSMLSAMFTAFQKEWTGLTGFLQD
jgi:hypothetical protein